MQVGDYVRTKSGFIDKIININDFREPSVKYALEQPSWNDDVVFVGDEDIIKSSSNIIDLIETGDYINGLRVEENKYGELYTSYVYYGGDIGKQCEVYTTWLEEYKENEDYIDSILTKEQFESMEYIVGVDKE